MGAALGVASIAGCAPTYTNHGFAPQMEALQDIAAGVDTRGSVMRKLGRPSADASFEDDTWYYVASRMEHFAFYEPEVIERTVVSVRFDPNGLVSEVDRFGLEDGRIVSLVTNTTPTYGRELNALQQIFGNVGRVNAGDVLGN
jgi:outer membrane protein assembly factor BamE (lipoprotein component of BamABCDE complex)